jgi:hypothetical protein
MHFSKTHFNTPAVYYELGDVTAATSSTSQSLKSYKNRVLSNGCVIRITAIFLLFHSAGQLKVLKVNAHSGNKKPYHCAYSCYAIWQRSIAG